ncbi:hypothetical protein JKA74_06590 [Marivirga sp. S37H4]|uniref:Uncharacterized protein n=1 Tax=Marivirga aurantiaca TaxID=2802615 RepID=A0A934WX23_9BACT|nr:hypothetical protein [Marivirga aurantiaca]MBK6264698.1 hypothetical protein [Marivirga aurantiaca]
MMKRNLPKRKQRGLMLLIGIVVGIVLFMGGFDFSKNISHNNKGKMEIKPKNISTPILYRFFS